MANIAVERNSTPTGSVHYQPILGPYGAAAATKYVRGLMATLDANGRPKNPGAVGEVVAGIIKRTVDNTDGANDALYVEFYGGVWPMDLHDINPPATADLAKFAPVYASDNHTVSRLAADGSLAGRIVGLEATKAWVWFGPLAVSSVIGGIGTAALTENGGAIGGVNNGDLPDIAAIGAAYSQAEVTAVRDAVREIAAKLNALIGDLTT